MPVRVEDIANGIQPVGQETSAAAAYSLFLSDPALFAIPIVTNGAPLGQVTRARLSEVLAGPNGRDIHASRPVAHFITPEPVMAEVGTPVALIAKLAADGNTSALTDGVIVIRDGRYSGLVSPGAILTAVAQENAARARAMQASAKRLEQARTSAQRQARDKSQFLAFLSHEIRTPLTGILGVADILQDSVSGSEPRRLARTISESGNHLDRLLGDLLDLSRLEAGKLPVSPFAFDLREFAGEARDLWQSRIAGKRLDLRISVDSGSVPRIEADGMRIRQILFNLMSNALKFTENGQVTVTIGTLEAAGHLKLRMKVSDTGCGISDADKARMFQAFEQARATTAQTHGGSGLGLSIAKGLTALMGGEITLADNPGGGTVFMVTLPVLRAGPRLAVDTPAKPRLRSLTLGRILVVEDHAVSALVISRALTAAGWQVDVCQSADEGITRAREELYQAVLCDIHMPGGNGETVVRTLRGSSGPNQLAPIIAVTADIGPDRKAACDAAGFTSMIEKPIRPRALVATLADVLMADADSGWELSAKRA
ncbi:ATP-binding protein [Hyphomonas johnsonii]|uniref:histidine kinase n=1 Tax=Hyphomonas johnsonii MHS-2 TaxID=1280950 RepID=A0A059FQL9_9PROT|nr:ATP-binding protein [Hyphomonas johnsonii]KCZ92960.1 sensor histidine kinase/response regulator [Hyphomonas johnsonii MHS-2]